jgi:DNA polymerase-3 subunit beta
MKNQLKHHFKIASKNTLPICDYLKISEKEIVADNLEIRISVKNEIPTTGEGLILASDFKKIIDKKTIDSIIFEDKKVILVCGKSNFSFATENLEDFIEEQDGFQDKGVINFDELFKVAQNFVGKDELRPAMMGVYFDKEYIVSTDAHTLYFKKHNQQLDIDGLIIPNNAFFVEGSFNFALKEKTHLKLTKDDLSIVVRLVDGKYPNYMAVIPTDNPNKVEFDKKELVGFIEDALICTNQTTKKVVLSPEGISSEDVDFDREFKGTFESRKVLQGEQTRQGFNGEKLLKVLKFVDNRVVIDSSTPNRAAIINDNFLLMPVML